MKTKLLIEIRKHYTIRYSVLFGEWALYNKKNSNRASYHHDLCVIITEALHAIYFKRKADRLSELLFNRTHCFYGKESNKYKITNKWKSQTTKTK